MDVILSTSNYYRATAEDVKGLRPDGRLVLIGVPDGLLELGPELMILARLRH